MNIISLVGLGIVSAILSVVIKQYRPEYSIYISLISGILILGAVITAVTPALKSLVDMIGGEGGYGEILLKALAICYITHFAAMSCEDAGEKAIAAKIDLAGRAALLILSLPLFSDLAGMIKELLK